MKFIGETKWATESTIFLNWVFVKHISFDGHPFPTIKRKIFTKKRYEEIESGEFGLLHKIMINRPARTI